MYSSSIIAQRGVAGHKYFFVLLARQVSMVEVGVHQEYCCHPWSSIGGNWLNHIQYWLPFGKYKWIFGHIRNYIHLSKTFRLPINLEIF